MTGLISLPVLTLYVLSPPEKLESDSRCATASSSLVIHCDEDGLVVAAPVNVLPSITLLPEGSTVVFHNR